MANVYNHAFELTDDELTAVSGTGGLGGLGIGGCSVCGAASVPTVAIPVAISIPQTSCAASTPSGPYINATTNSTNSSYSYNVGLQNSNVTKSSAFTMIN